MPPSPTDPADEAAPGFPRSPRRLGPGGALALLFAGASGALTATALPPLGIWPFGLIGFGLCYLVLCRHRAAARAAIGLAFGTGYFALGLAFLADFSVVGYLLLILLEAAFVAVAAVLVVPGPGRAARFAATLVLAEWLRDRLPFGGLPIASPALGQAAGPLAGLARLGGPLLVLAVTAGFGAALAELTRRRPAARAVRRRSTPPSRRAALLGIGALVLVVAASSLAPAGRATRGTIAFAAVQGGGPRGYPATAGPAGGAFLRTLSSSSELGRPLGLVLWPEDTVALATGAGDAVPDAVLDQLLRDEAERLDATLLVGATARVGRARFRNEILEFSPRGRLVTSYEKEHPVPFGEYVPLRGLLGHFVHFSAIPLDAIVGHRLGVVRTPLGVLGLAVSFETFFVANARATVRRGAGLLVVPTNTASYASAQLPAEELAASRLDAISTGRELVQDATTGYSALVSASGSVLAELPLGASGDLVATARLRTGLTLYDWTGDVLLVLLSALAVLCGHARDRWRRVRTG